MARKHDIHIHTHSYKTKLTVLAFSVFALGYKKIAQNHPNERNHQLNEHL